MMHLKTGKDVEIKLSVNYGESASSMEHALPIRKHDCRWPVTSIMHSVSAAAAGI
jgi:hypothetical protein